MTTRQLRALSPLLALALAALVIAGCGSGGSSENSASGTTNTAKKESEEGSAFAGSGKAPQTLKIKMTDFAFAPEHPTIKAGRTRIEAVNDGKVEHELVIFKTDKNPTKLPTEANGGVDEEKLDETIGETGEIPEVQAGETKSATFDLKPGRYVMFCNVPGHYAAGMYGTLEVTG